MNNTNISKEDNNLQIPENTLYPSCCEKNGDRIFAHTAKKEDDGIEEGIV